MIALTLEEISAAVAGTVAVGETEFDTQTVYSGASQTDSREVKAGDIFFARRGETTDGHNFIGRAVELGAALIICEKPTDFAELSVGVPQIVVTDTTEALNDLATEVVRRVNLLGRMQTVGITGSNGKTSTKNFVGAMLETVGETVASEKSFNNEVGGPMTALRVTETTEFLVAEMGASAEGEIARLVKMAPPNIGVVLTVGLAHAGEFGGIDSTFRAKSEMVKNLPADGVAVLNREDPRVAQMQQLTDARVRWFGLTSRCDVWAENIDVQAEGTNFTMHLDEESREVKFAVLGEHHVMNALAAATVAHELGMGIDAIVEVLERTTRPAKWRMEVTKVARDITIINDAYNASPDSMQAALKTLVQVVHPQGRSVAVLGVMSELGEFSGEQHDRLGLLAVRLGIDELIIVGEDARRLHISAINEGSWNGESVYFADQQQAKQYLLESLQPFDTVIFKSSNSAGLRFLGDEVKEALA